MRSTRLALGFGAAAAAVVLPVAAIAAPSAGVQQASTAAHASGRYAVGLWGDVPYGDAGRAQYPALLRSIDRAPLAFSVFDGDIKNGSERCDDAVYTTIRDSFDSLRRPVVYVPGDNEWTDCDRTSAGSFLATERLAHLRQVFFTDDQTRGQHTFTVQRQPGYPENQRWRRGVVTWLTAHVVGSDNNAQYPGATSLDPAADQAEYLARDRANQRWIRAAFSSARYARSKAVVLVIQADMWGDGPSDGFDATKRTLLEEATTFRGQVYLVNGDSHTYLIDKPLVDDADQVVQNFTRVQTPGEEQNHWVKATVDPRNRDVLSFDYQVVRANVPEYVIQ